MNRELVGHLKAAGKELLLALRSLIEVGVEFLEERVAEKEGEEEKKE